MMPEFGKCSLCKKGEFELKGKKVVSGTEYNMLKCKNCMHEVAKRVE